jgi:ABC-2 type transport system permease protein
MSHLRIYWIVFWKFRKIQLMRMMEFRANFIFWTVVSLIWTFFHIFFFTLVLGVSSEIGGWNTAQIYVLQSVFTIIDAIIWLFFYQNMQDYSRDVFNGTLNQHLLRPIDPQFILMTQNNSYNNVLRFLVGVGMLTWSVQRLPQPVSLFQVLLAILFIFLSLIFVYSLWFCLTTLSFWIERLDNINEIMPSTRRVFQVPPTIYTGVTSFVLMVLLPLGLVTSVPSQVLFGTLAPTTAIYFTVFTVLLALFSRWFFMFSIKKYTGVAN